MFKQVVRASAVAMIAASPAFAQSGKAKNSVAYDVTVTTEGTPYTGTMDLAVAGGKVTGDMHITAPTEITGTPAGTVKAGQFALEFPYRMVQRGCDGRIAMSFTLPPKMGPNPATGTVEITECGRPDGNKLAGTIELKAKAAPAKTKTTPKKQ
jgi:hypothetical protein